MKKIELLAPAKNKEYGIAAINHGADALYIGASKFGARQNAANDIQQIKQLADYAKPFGVKIYAALNTLIYEDELLEAEKVARSLVKAGVDALIIQDMSLLRMGLRGVEFHSSTQMTNIDPDEVAFLSEAGFSRVILERGLTMAQINDIRKNTDVELESFVHGAICVGYSGECYLSRSMGSRSGNRGECAQPCRLAYDLVDCAGNVIVKDKHLLSVRDMDLSSHLSQLIEAGISSFKIEGRLKDINYVKNTVAYYRRKLDDIIAGREGLERSSRGFSSIDFTPDPARTFSRHFTSWMLSGKQGNVSSFDTPKAVGYEVGVVAKCGRDHFCLHKPSCLAAGDGICFFTASGLQGTQVVKVDGDKIYGDSMSGIEVGTTIFCNYDRRFNAVVTKSDPKRRLKLDAVMHVYPEHVELEFSDELGNNVTVAGGLCVCAKDPAGMIDTYSRQVSKAGDTIFAVENVSVLKHSDVVPFMTSSQVNQLRRNGLQQMHDLLMSSKRELNIREENLTARYPAQALGGSKNIVNSKAAAFYKDHGVTSIEKGNDLLADYSGVRVMTTPYCIRREIGECLRGRHTLKGDLFLMRGDIKYKLQFDCPECMMNIVKYE